MSNVHDRRVPWQPASQKRVQVEPDEARYLPTKQQAGKTPLWDSTETVPETNLKKLPSPLPSGHEARGSTETESSTLPRQSRHENCDRLQSALLTGRDTSEEASPRAPGDLRLSHVVS